MKPRNGTFKILTVTCNTCVITLITQCAQLEAKFLWFNGGASQTKKILINEKLLKISQNRKICLKLLSSCFNFITF